VGAIVFAAAAIGAAYVEDRIGFDLHPWIVLATAAAATAAIVVRAAGRLRRESIGELLAFALLAVATFAALMRLAWPHLLPPGGGTDLTHHLLLVDYIERHGHLPRDPALAKYLGEMVDYTPGAHLLAVVVGRWFRTDGLHTIYALVAACVALKIGIVFLIARRLFSRNAAALPLALIAASVSLLPREYVVGSFTHSSYLAQVASETFAVAMWWAAMAWNDEPGPMPALIAGIAGAATFLTWPVWIGPTTLLFAALVVVRRDVGLAERARDAAIACGPPAIVAAVYAAQRAGAASIAATTGFALRPTLTTVGVPFALLAGVGVGVSLVRRVARTNLVLLAAIGLQAAALFALARTRGAETPYLSLKMFYLAVYPLAVAGAIAVDTLLRVARRGHPRVVRAAWTVAIAFALVVGRDLLRMPRPRPVVSDELRDAGRWTRGHLPTECVDYLMADDDTGYWLHLAVLGNPRDSPRATSSETFEPSKALVRWVLPDGLPYAIVEDLDALPKDIREHVDVLARFGRAAVVRRRRSAPCGQ